METKLGAEDTFLSQCDAREDENPLGLNLRIWPQHSHAPSKHSPNDIKASDQIGSVQMNPAALLLHLQFNPA
jgi:hypothetical protein